jgi:hypothetical protein
VLVCLILYFNILFFFPRIFGILFCFFKKWLVLGKWQHSMGSWKDIQMESLATLLLHLETSTGEGNLNDLKKIINPCLHHSHRHKGDWDCTYSVVLDSAFNRIMFFC